MTAHIFTTPSEGFNCPKRFFPNANLRIPKLGKTQNIPIQSRERSFYCDFTKFYWNRVEREHTKYPLTDHCEHPPPAPGGANASTTIGTRIFGKSMVHLRRSHELNGDQIDRAGI